MADHFDVLAAGFGDGAQNVAADAAEPVDGNAHCHGIAPGFPFMSGPPGAVLCDVATAQ